MLPNRDVVIVNDMSITLTGHPPFPSLSAYVDQQRGGAHKNSELI